jgi:hypothetical protein
LDLKLEFLDEYKLPKQDFQGTAVGGISGLTYDRQIDRFYALSDDRSRLAPARFYTLRLSLGEKTLEQVAIEKVTFLKNAQGENYPPETIDPEAIALSPAGNVFIASEGTEIADPFIQSYALDTGNPQQTVPLPQRYFPKPASFQGIQPNLGFEALAIATDGNTKDDPYRLFATPEFALRQDRSIEEDIDRLEQPIPLRLLHYLITGTTPPLLISEHLYPLDPPPTGTLSQGLTELITLPERGFFLSLERSYGVLGTSAKIYQVTTGTATDTSTIPSLRSPTPSLQPVRKKLVLDLENLGITLDNLEGMALGSQLADGSQSLILVSDDNFRSEQITQFLLFSLKIT